MTFAEWWEQVSIGVVTAWAAAIPIGTWIHRVTERRHQQRMALARLTIPHSQLAMADKIMNGDH